MTPRDRGSLSSPNHLGNCEKITGDSESHSQPAWDPGEAAKPGQASTWKLSKDAEQKTHGSSRSDWGPRPPVGLERGCCAEDQVHPRTPMVALPPEGGTHRVHIYTRT